MQPLGKVEVQHLAVAAGGSNDASEAQKPLRYGAGLLPQLAQRRRVGILPALQLSGGNLLEHPGEDIAVLLDGQHAVVVVKGDDGDAAGVIRHLAHARLAVGQKNGVPKDAQDPAFVYGFTCQLFFRHIHPVYPQKGRAKCTDAALTALLCGICTQMLIILFIISCFSR